MIETLAHGYSSERTQQELSNEYQDDRVKMVLKKVGILVLWMKVASALEGISFQPRLLWLMLLPSGRDYCLQKEMIQPRTSGDDAWLQYVALNV